MTARADQADRTADRIAGEKAYRVFAIVLILSFFVNSASVIDEWRRVGVADPALAAWYLEGTSLTLQLALFPVVRMFERRFPVDGTVDAALIAIHLAASVAYCVAHVAGMVALREMLWLVTFADHYPGLGTVLTELVYEYRKDVMTYGLILFLLYMFRTRELATLEAAAARADAQTRQQVTLKCGGRTIYLDADTVEFAKAAGNYVEVTAGETTHLARMTLAQLERLLFEAGADPVRVHRSWLVRRSAIAEVAPTRDGGAMLRLSSGKDVPVSRKYRDAVSAQ